MHLPLRTGTTEGIFNQIDHHPRQTIWQTGEMNVTLYVESQTQLRLLSRWLKEPNQITYCLRKIEPLAFGSHQIMIDNRRL